MATPSPTHLPYFLSRESLDQQADINAKRIAELTEKLHSSQKELAALRAAAAAAAAASASPRHQAAVPTFASSSVVTPGLALVAPVQQSPSVPTSSLRRTQISVAPTSRRVSRKPRASPVSQR